MPDGYQEMKQTLESEASEEVRQAAADMKEVFRLWEGLKGKADDQKEQDAAKIEAYARGRMAQPSLADRLEKVNPEAYKDSTPEGLRKALCELLEIKPLLPDFLTGAEWQGKLEPRRWLADGWLSAGELSMVAGPGEVGKSLLLLQLAAGLACDRDILNKHAGWMPWSGGEHPPDLCTDPITTVVCNWEDDVREMLRRRRRMGEFGKLGWITHPSINGRLQAAPMRGKGAIFGGSEGQHIATRGALTDTGKALLGHCEKVKAGLLVVDPVSLGISVNENDRSLVSEALETFAGWCSDTSCAVLLAGHPAKSKEGESADYSGSTAWRGLVRALWTLRYPEALTNPTKGLTESKEKAEAREIAARIRKEYAARKNRVAELSLNKNNYAFSDGLMLTLETIGESAAWHARTPIKIDVKQAAGAGNGRYAPNEIA